MERIKPKEMFHEDIKATEEAANNHSRMIDNYHKQLNGITGFYAHFFGTMGSHMVKLFPQAFQTGGYHFQNRDPLGIFNQQAGAINPDISRKYKDAIDTHLEVSKNLFKASIDTHKKIMEDVHNHFNVMVNQTQTFWGEVLETDHKPLTEEDAYEKDPGSDDRTKKSVAPVNEAKDLKSK
jgi:hypothetical protein